MSIIGFLNIGVGANTKGLRKGLNKARGDVKGFSKGIKGAGGSVAGLVTKFAALAGATLTVGAAVAGVSKQFGKLDQIGKFSDTVGLSIDQFKGFELAATLTGTSTQTLEKGLQRMVRRLGEAKLGLGQGVSGLKQLGLNATELANLPTADALGQISDAIKGQPGPAEKAAAAYSLFGKQGLELLTFLEQGSDGLKAVTEEAKGLTGGLSRVDVGQVEAANDAIAKMQFAFEGVFQQVAVQIAPFITVLVDKIVAFGQSGMSASEIVTSGLEMVVKGIGMAADVVDLLMDGFRFLQAGASKAIAMLLDHWAFLAEGIEFLLNKLPGVEVAFSGTLKGMAKAVDELAGEQWDNARAEFEKPPPSEGIEQFFNDVKAEAKAAAEAILANSAGKAAAQAALEANKPALKFIESLESQIRTLEMGADAAKLYEFKTNGASDAILAQVDALQKQKKALDENEKLKSKAESIFDQTRTPLEQFQSKVAELQTLLGKGLIDQDTFDRAFADAEGKLGKPQDVFAGALDFNSTEARSIVLNNRNGKSNKPLNAVAKNTESAVTEQQHTNVLLKKMNDRLTAGSLPQFPIG